MYRVTPGQMFGERRYRPWRLRSAGTKLEPDLADAFVALARVRITPIDRAVSDLVRGDTDRAITGFELAARVPSVAPEALTDLAAAYLLRFEKESDCIDLLRAVQAADSGLSLHPDNASLRFNRATALSLLGTRMRAAAAWQEIEQTFSDGWKEEAVAELRDLRRPSLDEEWAKVLPKIESPGSTAAEVMSLTRQFPANARLFAEEVLLPRWAAAVAAGDTPRAARSLVTATFIGAELRSHGEDLLADAVTSIGITMRDGPEEKRQALLRGLQDFGVGVVQYNEQNLISASAPLARSTDELAAADHPLRYWSRFYLAISEYYADAGRGLAVLDALLAEIPQERYPALVGRIEWIAGTSEKVQGNVETSVRRYEHAATNLRRAGGEPAAAFISVLLAESYTQLGQHSLAWEHRRLAFKHVPSSEGLRRNIAMWTEAKQALLRQGSIAVAAPLVEEAVAVADRWGRPLGRATAYLNRAEYRVEVGDRDGAWADLQQAKAAVSQMEPSGMRDQMSFLALITEGLCDRSTDPAKAAELLERGLQGQSSTRTRSGAISYTTAMADAQVAAGHPMQGAASLERVIAMFEDVRATVEDPVARMQAFRQAQPAFDQLIELRTTLLPDDREAAFRLAERSRARVLLEMTAGAPSIREDGFVRLAELERLLPPDSALVSFVVLKNRVLAWVVQNGQARQIALPIARAEIEVLIDGFRLELKRGGNAQAIREAGMPLYDALIRPLALASDGRSLIIIPDRRLARLPFAALADRESGQYLIEQRTVTIAASATLLMRRSEQRRRDPPAKASALAIGIARSGTHGGRFLPALPYAESEASHVARLYPESTLLIGKEATRENFSRMAVSSDVVHLAGHAVVDLDAPRRSVLLFASSLNDSLVPLSLDELFEAGLGKASLIVLSACRAQDSLADDREGLLGLAGAFIAAGAGEVLASPLDVSDEAVTPVMIAFHTHYRNERSAARAFREAVLELLHSGDERISSPAAWGGFTVIQGSLSDRR
jgi:CHAT domain-containing protein